MKKIICLVLVLGLFLLSVSFPYASTLDNQEILSAEGAKFSDDTIIVMFNNETSLDFNMKTRSDFPEIDVKSVVDLSTGSTIRTQEKIANIVKTAKVQSLMNDVTKEFALEVYDEDIEKYRQIVCLKLNTTSISNVLDTIQKLSKRADIEYVGPDYIGEICSTIPNDYNSTVQWGLDAINCPEAWNIAKGSNTIKVGVLDTGIDGSHPDLSNRISTTLNRSFTTGTAVVETVPTDVDMHGTHVAGIIGAQVDNSIGMAGVCWDVELVSLKVYTSISHLQVSWLIAAIDYATVSGIDVLNFSGVLYSNSDALYNTIANYPGVFVCAAGQTQSSGRNIDVARVYPASYDLSNIIAVGLITSNDSTLYNTNWHSNYGAESVDLFAPGYNIYSTVPGNSYRYDSGTSMATPFVTGAVVLLMSVHPSISVSEIKESIINNVDKLPDVFLEKCVSGGELNIYKALNNPAHTLVYTSTSSLYTHTLTCLDCNYSYQHEHTWKFVLNQYVCLKCSKRTSTIPSIRE